MSLLEEADTINVSDDNDDADDAVLQQAIAESAR